MSSKKLIFNPFTEKEVNIDPYGNTAKKIYKYLINTGVDPEYILPADLSFNNNRFKKVKIVKDLSNVNVITYPMVHAAENQTTYLRNIMKKYKGQTITRSKRYMYEGVQKEVSETIKVPTSFSAWWKTAGSYFFWIDSEEFIFSDSINDELSPKLQAQVVILSHDKVGGENYKQYFLDASIGHCVFNPMRDWGEMCFDEAKSKPAKYRYSGFIKKVAKLAMKYKDGVPELDLPFICNELQVGIEIDLPSTVSRDTKFIDVRSQKKPKKIFKFINTRLDHIEPNGLKSKDNRVELPKEQMKNKYDELIKTGEFVLWKESLIGITQINTLDCVYVLSTDEGYMGAVLEFQDVNNLRDYRVEHNSNKDLSNFLMEGCITNQSKVFLKDYDPEIDAEPENLNHIDMKKSYSRGGDCFAYEGYLGKITDFRKTDKIMGIGIYLINNVDYGESTAEKDMIREMDVLHSGNSYPSPELKYYQSIGIKFDIECGCWGSGVHIEFTPRMFDKEDGVSHYSKWYGNCMKFNDKERFNFNCKDIKFAKLNAHHDQTTDIRYNEDEKLGLIEYTRKKIYHDFHIASFISSYARLNLIEQLQKFKKEQIVAIQVDGIYYTGDVEIGALFSKKEKITIHHVDADARYVEPDFLCLDDFNMADNREHNMREVHTGPGGCGKTHLNLADKGFIAPLYVAPSWKLARTKKKDYGCESSVFFRLLSDDPDKYRPLVRNYSVIIIDEISMLSNEFKEIILKRFRHHKLIFCGDIGYQLPPIEGSEFEIGDLPEKSHTTNHRCQCKKLLKILQSLRKTIKKQGCFAAMGKPKDEYFGIKVVKDIDYKVEDLIIAATHEQKNKHTQKYKHLEKYVVLENTRDHSNGEILFHKPEKVRCELRHCFTVHSIQGETAQNKLFIDMNIMRSMKMFYTSLSRARTLDQIVLFR